MENEINYDNIKIDKHGFVKQYHENIIKTDHYVSVKIVIGNNDEEVYVDSCVHNVNSIAITKMILALQETIQSLKENDPMQDFLTDVIKGQREEL